MTDCGNVSAHAAKAVHMVAELILLGPIAAGPHSGKRKLMSLLRKNYAPTRWFQRLHNAAPT